MRFKEGADITGLHPEMIIALNVANEVYTDHGEELVVTSVVEGKHSYASLHYFGCAVDLRTRYFEPSERGKVRDQIKKKLPDAFDVILEANHIHIEYQPKR